MIRVDGLTKRFGTTLALDGVSLNVERGEIVGLLGPNGAGKTTMMRLLTGYLAPTSGSASVAGFDVQANPLEVRRRIGYLPETVPVYSELTVREYLEFTGAMHDVSRADLPTRMGACMEQTGIADVSHRLIGHLSKGYRQRVGIAQALLHGPDLLILDEPTVGLDPTQVVEIRGLIRRLAERHTVVLSSHILPEVSQICSRVIIIDRGRIVAAGTLAELESRLKGTENIRVVLKGAGPEAADEVRNIGGVRTVTPGEAPDGATALAVESELGRDIREDLFGLAVRKNWPILELHSVSMSLEEVFSRLTRQEALEAPGAPPAGPDPGASGAPS